ncbi:MAG: TspO/MBR family protein [Candidatus Paceibacterota bacterium]
MKINYIFIPLITIATAWIGNYLTFGGMAWYKTINLPSWTPPGFIIGTVWTILFILAAISAIIVWNAEMPDEKLALIVIFFVVNALLNIGWSLLFFNLHLIGASVFEAGFLGLSVLALVIFIWPVSVLAAALLIPYFLWVSFATYLTYSVWIIN